MSFFTWFTARKPRHAVAPPKSARREATRPAPLGIAQQSSASNGSGASAQRKHERLARRELLYTVVREAMARAGVLSASYRFKVLSLDGRGSQFLVMVDLAQGALFDAGRLSEIEGAITRVARSRYELQVQAVYWRSSETMQLPQAQADAQERPKAQPHVPAKVAPFHPVAAREARTSSDSQPSQPAELLEPTRGPGGRFEPLHAAEVAAFQQALARGMGDEPEPAQRKPGSQNYTLLTGFEDTEMEGSPPEGKLSATQYGALR